METKTITLSVEQLKFLKDTLECWVECTYDSFLGEMDDETKQQLVVGIQVTKEVCNVLQVEETISRTYRNCLEELVL